MARLWRAAAILMVCLPLLGAGLMPPTVDYYVNDAAAMVNEEHRASMLELARSLDKGYGAQLVLLTVPSLDELRYEQDAAALAGEIFFDWEVGGRTEQRGVLILAVGDPAGCAVHVGDGFAGELTPAQARAAANQTAEEIAAGNPSQALLDLHTALAARLGEILGVDAATQADTVTAQLASPIVVLAVVAIAVARSFRVSGKYRRRFGKGYVYKRRVFAHRHGDGAAPVRGRSQHFDSVGMEPTRDELPPEEE